MKDNYFIPSGYAHNPPDDSHHSVTGESYWSPRRRRGSAYLQYPVYQLAHAIAVDNKARTIVDVGCGVPTKLLRFFDDRFAVFGVDQTATVEDCVRQQLRGTYIAEDLESPSNAVRNVVGKPDLIICADVIEHLSKPEVLLDYMHRLAGDSTQIVISTPERDALLGSNAMKPSNRAHVREWSYGEFARFVESSRFAIHKHCRVLPMKMSLNAYTAGFVVSRLIRGLPFQTAQVVVCREQ